MIVYMLAKANHTVHGKCELLFLLGTLIIYLSLVLAHLKVSWSSELVELVINFGFVVAFAWMTIMSYDVWAYFRFDYFVSF